MDRQQSWRAFSIASPDRTIETPQFPFSNFYAFEYSICGSNNFLFRVWQLIESLFNHHSNQPICSKFKVSSTRIFISYERVKTIDLIYICNSLQNTDKNLKFAEMTSSRQGRTQPEVINAIIYEQQGPVTEDEVKNCLPSAGAGKNPLGMDGSIFRSLDIPVITKSYNKILLAWKIHLLASLWQYLHHSREGGHHRDGGLSTNNCFTS
ncbi:unnamed protein product [Lepeophtheirus salmonis]|uniref:(salmon louse) hypothetical protein n=1 Tax=Lepeophtheirus salmonis TaxID=72036 RepID=A0A7R8H970_LEPSM|nr:unnamed protein product [Lepeophtheirus salmonis]CAF2944046.1 unnamed protein product [Lepeophtheirus salmonis]